MQCCYMDVRAFSDPALYERIFREIPWQKRRDRILRCKFEKDRLLCLGADYLLMRFLREETHLEPEIFILEEGPHGKPFLTTHPGLHFNLSHSGNYAALAGGTVPCGIDVEKTRVNYDKIAQRFFTETERKALAFQDTDAARNEAFLRIWTRKESYLKLSGVGLSRDLLSFNVLPDAPEDAVFYEHALPDHLLTVCISKEDVMKGSAFKGFEECFLYKRAGTCYYC